MLICHQTVIVSVFAGQGASFCHVSGEPADKTDMAARHWVCGGPADHLRASHIGV